jgi:uncharacterized repeat protein (TIGR03803 family)
MNSRLPEKLLPVCGLALAILAAPGSATAGGYRVLHAFSGDGDGAQPWAAPMMDSAGDLYGTTLAGGSDNSGTIFKLAPDGTETVLFNFCRECSGGELPHAGLIVDKAGNLYGAATYGGINGGLGVVFKLASDGTETVLHAFAGGSADGNYPYGGVLMDKSGNLFGTTAAGGPDNAGMVYRLAPDGTETVLHFFANSGGDGDGPMGALVADRHGDLYGTTPTGGSADLGVIFKVTPDGKESILHSFAGAPNDGGEPATGLIIDGAGNLYGSTWSGGTNNMGSVFRLAPDGTETLLHSLAGPPNEGRGAVGGVVMDKSGNLYGATFTGGAYGAGTIYRVASDGALTTLNSFCPKQDCRSGGWPVAGPVLGKNGALFGVTEADGKFLDGAVYKLNK